MRINLNHFKVTGNDIQNGDIRNEPLTSVNEDGFPNEAEELGLTMLEAKIKRKQINRS